MRVAVLVFGVCLLAIGCYAYLGRGAEAMYRRVPIGPFVNVVHGQIPYGAGFSAIGMAMFLKTGWVSDVLSLCGLGCMAVGVILWFWHPYALRPRWLRNAWGD